MQPTDKLMSRLVALFGEPKTEDVETMCEEFREAMGRYNADVLKEVGDRCRDRFKWWPRIAELITLANDAKWDLEAPAREAARAKAALDDAAEYERDMARRVSKASVDEIMVEFRAKMAALSLAEAIRKPKLTAPTREDFQAMQLNSPNHELHRAQPGKPAVYHQTSNEAMAEAITHRGGRS